MDPKEEFMKKSAMKDAILINALLSCIPELEEPKEEKAPEEIKGNNRPDYFCKSRIKQRVNKRLKSKSRNKMAKKSRKRNR